MTFKGLQDGLNSIIRVPYEHTMKMMQERSRNTSQASAASWSFLSFMPQFLTAALTYLYKFSQDVCTKVCKS